MTAGVKVYGCCSAKWGSSLRALPTVPRGRCSCLCVCAPTSKHRQTEKSAGVRAHAFVAPIAPRPPSGLPPGHTAYGEPLADTPRSLALAHRSPQRLLADSVSIVSWRRRRAHGDEEEGALLAPTRDAPCPYNKQPGQDGHSRSALTLLSTRRHAASPCDTSATRCDTHDIPRRGDTPRHVRDTPRRAADMSTWTRRSAVWGVWWVARATSPGARVNMFDS